MPNHFCGLQSYSLVKVRINKYELPSYGLSPSKMVKKKELNCLLTCCTTQGGYRASVIYTKHVTGSIEPHRNRLLRVKITISQQGMLWAFYEWIHWLMQACPIVINCTLEPKSKMGVFKWFIICWHAGCRSYHDCAYRCTAEPNFSGSYRPPRPTYLLALHPSFTSA